MGGGIEAKREVNMDLEKVRVEITIEAKNYKIRRKTEPQRSTSLSEHHLIPENNPFIRSKE